MGPASTSPISGPNLEGPLQAIEKGESFGGSGHGGRGLGEAAVNSLPVFVSWGRRELGFISGT